MLYEDLGDIEFLRDHPEIRRVLIIKSRNFSLEPFIKNRYADFKDGGFAWREASEGHSFWDIVLGEKNPIHFYTKYTWVKPPIKKK